MHVGSVQARLGKLVLLYFLDDGVINNVENLSVTMC